MPADRPLRNVTRDRLLGIYVDLQTEPADKKYNLRKELQTDRRDATVYANRWVTSDQFVEMARQELVARGIDLPTTAAAAPASAGGESPAEPTPEQTAESLGPASDL